MIYLISSLFYILSFSILADEHISLSLLNSELKKNYAFTERSLNQSDLKIESSSGNIFIDPNGKAVDICILSHSPDIPSSEFDPL